MTELTREQDTLMRKLAASVAKREFDQLRRLGFDTEAAIALSLDVLTEVKDLARRAA